LTEVQAVAKYVRISPRKARLVVDHIRGRTVPEARTVLAFSERAAAREISKVLRSAIANAETNPGLHWDGDELVVSSAFVDEGPTIKRWRARARGRVSRINKRTCHITIRLTLPGEAPEPVPAVAAASAPAVPPMPAAPVTSDEPEVVAEPAAVEVPEAVAEPEAVEEPEAVAEPEAVEESNELEEPSEEAKD
jgi:large subunit ribosomal protein L22